MSYLGNTQQNQSYYPAVDFFSGNGSTTAFTLSRPVYSTPMVQVTIANVPQNPGSAFTISGSTITFTSAPPSGTNNIYVYYTSPNTSVATMPQSPVITGDVTSTGGQYTIGSFNSGYTDGLVQDYTTGTGRFTVGGSDGFGFYNGGPSARNYLFGCDSAGNVGIGTSSPFSATGYKSVTTNGATGGIFSAYGNGTEYGRWLATSAGAYSIALNNVPLILQTIDAQPIVAYTNNTERMRIDAGGNLCLGATATVNTAKCFISSGTQEGIRISQSSGNMYPMAFMNGGTVVGSIQTSGTNTAYNTSSDYRLKENVKPMTNALSVVSQLNPVTYTWKADGSDGQGFIAHELQAVVPDCVTGEKDAVDEDGKPVYQGIDTSFLVATLTKAIQELKAEVDALKAQLEAK